MLQIETNSRPDSQQTGLANSSRDPLGTEEKGSGRGDRPGPLDRAMFGFRRVPASYSSTSSN